MKPWPSTACAILVSLLLAFQQTAHASDGWSDLELEGDKLFGSARFSEAAEMYNESAQLALQAGQDLEAARILAKLGRCFAKDRLNNSQLFVEYLGWASDLASRAASNERDPAERAKLYLDSASYAAEAGLNDKFRAQVNSSAFSYLDAAEGEDVANGSAYIKKAGYLFQFNDLTEYVDRAFLRYRSMIVQEVQRESSEAKEAVAAGQWEAAGLKYFNAAIRTYDLQEPYALTLFGLAAEALAIAADSMSFPEELEAGNLSHRAYIYRIAAICAEFNSSDGSELFRRAGETYSLAADRLLASGELSRAISNLTEAALMYEKAGLAQLSDEKYVQAAKTAEKLAGVAPATGYGMHLEAAILYDRAGRYGEAAKASYRSLEAFTTSLGTAIYVWPWQELQFLQILGRGRRLRDAREFSTYLAAPVTFFGGPSFGGYDLMAKLGPAIAQNARTNLAYDAYVTETFLLAASFLLNDLPGPARSLLEGVSGKAVLMDPPNRAMLDLLSAVLQAQQIQGPLDPRVSLAYDALQFIYFEDATRSLANSIANAVSNILSGQLASQLFMTASRGILSCAMDDLRRAARYDRTIEDFLVEAQRLSAKMAESPVRNATQHLAVIPFWEAAARRWSFQGKLNESGAGYLYEQASYHACAGEDYQAAILFHDLSWGCYGFRTPITAAVYAIANAMMSENQTMKEDARRFILGNLSAYIPKHELAALLSVLEGRTELEPRSGILRALAMGLMGAFVLLTSYALLIWEQKNPLEAASPARRRRPPRSQEARGQPETRHGKMEPEGEPASESGGGVAEDVGQGRS